MTDTKQQKKVVSPFEFAITEIADSEAAKNMRPETDLEKMERIRAKFQEIAKQLKIKKP